MKKVTKETHLQLLLIILLVAAVILMAQHQFVNKKVVSVAAPSPLPYVAKPMSQEAKDLKAKLTKTDRYTGTINLADQPEFSVEYDIVKDNFLVNVKEAPYSTSKVKAQDWFVAQGFAGFDLCTLKITFIPVREIGANLTNADLVFDRCPVPDTSEATPQASSIN